MDGGDRWHVAARGSHDRAVLESVVALRFRPIAPKPVAGGNFHAGVSPPETRPKRRYVRVRKDGGSNNNNNNKRTRENKRSAGETFAGETIRPETGKSDGRESPESGSRKSRSEISQGSPVAAAESWVTVEHVTDTCMAGELGLGCTDAERPTSLEGDTCPGFVSDSSLTRVEWVNEAYRRMVAAPEVVVRLSTVAGSGGPWGCTDGVVSFTCRVRVQYWMRNDDNNNKMERCWKIIPCDVWRLECGGFAWRLDVKAALSLGL